MAEVNRAYAEGDEVRLGAVLNEWETSPDAVTGHGVGAELVRTIRKIHQVEGRLAGIEIEIGKLNGAELSLLKARADSARTNGRDLLAEMADRLDMRILSLRRKGDGLKTTEATS